MSTIAEKKLKTACVVFLYIARGLCVEIGGPSMIDLMLILNLNYEEIARALSALGLGCFPAVIISVIFTDRFGDWKDLVVAVSQTVGAIAIISVPFATNVNVMWGLYFISGTVTFILNFVSQRIILEVWAEKSPSPIHAIHCGFGVGALLAPIIANPFLAVTTKMTSYRNITNATGTLGLSLETAETIHVIEDSRVQYAFVVIAAATLASSLPFWLFQARDFMKGRRGELVTSGVPRLQNRRSFKKIVNPATYSGGSMALGVFVIILLFLFYFNVVGGEQSFGNFVRTYSVDELGFSKDSASYLNLVYWVSHSVGRFACFILALWIPIRYVFFAEALLNLLAATACHIFAARSRLSLWLCTAVQGLVVSPLYPSCLAFGDTLVEARGLVLVVNDLAGGLGYTFYVWITGYMYDLIGPRAMLIGMQVSGIILFILTSIFLTVGYFRGNRFDIHRGKRSNEDIAISSSEDSRNIDITDEKLVEDGNYHS